MEREPKSRDGDKVKLENGMMITHNLDKYLWKLCGINFSVKGDIIYRAYNSTTSTDIFIITPSYWSKEGLALSF